MTIIAVEALAAGMVALLAINHVRAERGLAGPWRASDWAALFFLCAVNALVVGALDLFVRGLLR